MVDESYGFDQVLLQRFVAEFVGSECLVQLPWSDGCPLQAGHQGTAPQLLSKIASDGADVSA